MAYDLQWQNATALFPAPASPAGGITYDAADNALWITTWDGFNSTVLEFSLTGTLLNSFQAAQANLVGLAYDPADDTLWAVGGVQLLQYSKAGVLLQSGFPSGLPQGPYLSGEIAQIEPPSVPEPASLALLGTGLAGLWFAVRRRKRLLA